MWAGMQREEVEGVPVFWAEGPGTPTATLTFRVGVIDETLYLKGITHMVEHLALQPLALQSYHYNGFVDHLRTSFTVTGEPEDLTAFLRTVCTTLAALPLDRFEHERDILLTESARYSPGGVDGMLAMRYGPRGPGLPGYPELGLHHIGPERVAEWAGKYFRRENAVLWLTAPPPEQLSLPLSAGGSRHPIAEPEPVGFGLPGWTTHEERGLALSSVHQRSVAASALPGIVERRLQATLRYDKAVAYEIGSTYFPLSAGTGFSAIWTDTTKENAIEARDVILSTLEDLATAGPTEEEVRHHKEAFEKAYDGQYAAASMLDSTTQSYLMDPESIDKDVLAETRALTAEDVRVAAGKLRAAAIYSVPEGIAMSGSYARVPESSTAEVQGRKYTPVAGGPERIILGTDGITLHGGKGRRATIMFDRCEAMTQWKDGSRYLYGSDGFGITILPSVWRRGDQVVKVLDDRLAARAVSMKGDAPHGPVAPVPAARRNRYLTWAAFSAFLALGALLNALDAEARANGELTGALIGLVLFSALAAASLYRHFRG